MIAVGSYRAICAVLTGWISRKEAFIANPSKAPLPTLAAHSRGASGSAGAARDVVGDCSDVLHRFVVQVYESTVSSRCAGATPTSGPAVAAVSAISARIAVVPAAAVSTVTTATSRPTVAATATGAAEGVELDAAQERPDGQRDSLGRFAGVTDPAVTARGSVRAASAWFSRFVIEQPTASVASVSPGCAIGSRRAVGPGLSRTSAEIPCRYHLPFPSLLSASDHFAVDCHMEILDVLADHGPIVQDHVLGRHDPEPSRRLLMYYQCPVWADDDVVQRQYPFDDR